MKKAYIAPKSTALAVKLQQMIAYSGGDNTSGVNLTGGSDTSPSTEPNRSRDWDEDWDEEDDW
jgi:hypothetical protein